MVKSLATKLRWKSKMMAVNIPGHASYSYLVRQGLGAGSNLAITCLYLSLLEMVAAGRPIGAHLVVLLDNTAAENKNQYMLYFLAWLVQRGVCDEASIFSMLVGHTYTDLDQSFNTLISQLGQVGTWTIEDMRKRIVDYMHKYDMKSAADLHCLWNWHDFLTPHIEGKFKGFCTSMYGSGMHEFLLRKDAQGQVRFPDPRRLLIAHAPRTAPPPCATPRLAPVLASLCIVAGAFDYAQVVCGNNLASGGRRLRCLQLNAKWPSSASSVRPGSQMEPCRGGEHRARMDAAYACEQQRPHSNQSAVELALREAAG